MLTIRRRADNVVIPPLISWVVPAAARWPSGLFGFLGGVRSFVPENGSAVRTPLYVGADSGVDVEVDSSGVGAGVHSSGVGAGVDSSGVGAGVHSSGVGSAVATIG